MKVSSNTESFGLLQSRKGPFIVSELRKEGAFMHKTGIIVLAFAMLAGTTIAQKQSKPWSEWSKKDAEKILNESPWGQTQTDTDTSEMFFDPTTQGGRGDSASRRSQGATNSEVHVNFRIRFFTARPIRQALV